MYQTAYRTPILLKTRSNGSPAGSIRKEPWKLFWGFLYGGLAAQLVFFLHGKNVDRALKDPEKMGLIQKGGYYLRLLIRGAVLLSAYFIPFTSITAAFVGLMTVPAAIYLLTFVSVGQLKKQEKRKGAEDTIVTDRGDAEGGEE